MPRFHSFVGDLFPRRSASSSYTVASYSSFSPSTPSLPFTTMSSASISSGASLHTAAHPDTGFPDSLAASTTSRRHPDAKIGELAYIESDEMDHYRALERAKHRLIKKHRRAMSHGKPAHTTLDTIFADEDGIVVEGIDGQGEAHGPQTTLEGCTTATTDGRDSASSPTSSHGDNEKRRSIFRWSRG